MSANTGLDRLAVLFAAAVDLINKRGRTWYETKAFFDALQHYKEGTLGWVEPKFSPVDHRIMFTEAIHGNRGEYERLLDSLREFGVNRLTIQKLKSFRAQTLLELWQAPLTELYQHVDHGHWPTQHVIGEAFLEIQKKIGIKKPVCFPVTAPASRKELQKLADSCVLLKELTMSRSYTVVHYIEVERIDTSIAQFHPQFSGSSHIKYGPYSGEDAAEKRLKELGWKRHREHVANIAFDYWKGTIAGQDAAAYVKELVLSTRNELPCVS